MGFGALDIKKKIKLQYFNLFEETKQREYDYILDGSKTWFNYSEVICKVDGNWPRPEIFRITFQMRKRIHNNIELYKNLSDPDVHYI